MLGVTKLINALLMPRVDGKYVSERLYPAVALYGITIGENSLSFREYDPMEEHRYPLKGSQSTDNHIKFKDIVLICERRSYWEILLWNGYIFTLSKCGNSKNISNTFRDVRNMSYFAIKRPVSPQEIAQNMRYPM